MIEITLPKPLYVLSRKEYASGEVVFEFIIKDNTNISAVLSLTLRGEGAINWFKIGKEYDIGFKPRQKTEG